MSFKVVIPARYASVRLPGKPLLDIAGKPMVVRVVEQAIVSGADAVVVATDHIKIAEAVKQYGQAHLARAVGVKIVSGQQRSYEPHPRYCRADERNLKGRFFQSAEQARCSFQPSDVLQSHR